MLTPWIQRGNKALQEIVSLLFRPPPPPALAPALCTTSIQPSIPGSSYTVQSILNDFRIVLGVPKYRTPKPRIFKRKFGYTRLFHAEEGLTTCKDCGFSHHVSTICGVCYEKIRDVTNAIKKEVMKYNPYVGERQNKEVVVAFEGESPKSNKKSQRVVEVPRERPSWFKSKLNE
uniref:39S ribosomal protein L32, mitochondrial n=1 Tax=Panagrellus redivivus TaxID=6233 RepID=A0A7E4UW04_PANRE